MATFGTIYQRIRSPSDLLHTREIWHSWCDSPLVGGINICGHQSATSRCNHFTPLCAIILPTNRKLTLAHNAFSYTVEDLVNFKLHLRLIVLFVYPGGSFPCLHSTGPYMYVHLNENHRHDCSHFQQTHRHSTSTNYITMRLPN